jgi:hypothetical protein
MCEPGPASFRLELASYCPFGVPVMY